MSSETSPPGPKKPAKRKRVSKKAARDLPRVGWREWVGLPDLGVDAVKAKVDTGARSSSIHAVNVRTETRDGLRIVRFTIHPVQRSVARSVDAEAVIHDERTVRSSSGKATERIVIVTPVTVCGRTWPVEVTLANRAKMGFRMLLGRQAVRGRFLVDSGNSYYGGKPTRDNPARDNPARDAS